MKKKNIIVLFSVFVLVLGVFFYKKISTKNITNNTNILENKDSTKENSEDKKTDTKNIKKDTKDSFYADKDIQFKDLLEKKKPIILDFSQST